MRAAGLFAERTDCFRGRKTGFCYFGSDKDQFIRFAAVSLVREVESLFAAGVGFMDQRTPSKRRIN